MIATTRCVRMVTRLAPAHIQARSYTAKSAYAPKTPTTPVNKDWRAKPAAPAKEVKESDSFATDLLPELPVVKSTAKPNSIPSPSASKPAAAKSPTKPKPKPVTPLVDLPISIPVAVPPAAPAPAAAAAAATPRGQLTNAQLLAQVAQLQQEKASLLNEKASLQHENHTFQSQLVYHSAVEAIYGETGLNQLRNIISDLTEEEQQFFKSAGFETDNMIQQLEARQRDLCLQFTHSVGGEIAKYPHYSLLFEIDVTSQRYMSTHIKKLKDQHRQSASAVTATQQTLRNAGVPDSIVSSSVASMQPHLDELQAKLARWEKLKADVDLLIATHGNH